MSIRDEIAGAEQPRAEAESLDARLGRDDQFRGRVALDGTGTTGKVPIQVQPENQETIPVRRNRNNRPSTTGPGMSPADVHQVAFRKPMLGRRGYAEDEVDAFLDAIEQDLAQPDGTTPKLRPDDVRTVAFKPPALGKRGYAEQEVDDFLHVVATELERRWRLARPDGT